MADNVELSAGSGGDVIAADDVSGVKYQLVQLVTGADGGAKSLVTGTTPLPVGDASGSLTVDAPVGTPVFVRLSDGSAAITALPVTDNSGSLTVDGTVAATQSGAWNVTNISGTVSLPTGAATAAKQPALGTAGTASSDVITVQGITSMTPLLATLSGTNNIATVTTVTTVAAVTAITNALPAGDNNIGNVDIASALPAGTNNIGDVDVLSVVPGTGATNLGKAIDSAAGGTDTGIAPLAIRDDSLSALTPAEGDYVPLRVNSTGALHVTGGGGGTQYAVDDAAGGTDTGTLALAVRDDSLTTLTPVDGDYVPLRVSSTGALHVTGGGGGTEYTEDEVTADPIVGTATLMERDDSLSTLTPAEGDWAGMRCNSVGALWTAINGTVVVSGAVSATQSGTWNIGTVSAVTNVVTVNTVTSLSQFAGNAINLGAGAVGSGTLRTTLASNDPAVALLGTIDTDTGGILTAVQLIDDAVFADDAAYTIGTSKVMVAGGVVDDDSTDAADEGDAVAFRATKERKLRTVAALDSAHMQSGNDQVTPKFAVIAASSSGDNTLVAAVTDKKIRVLSYTLVANGTVTVRFESGAAGTALTGQMDFVVNTGVSVAFSPVGHFETAANTLLNLELSGAVEVAGHVCYIEVD